MAKEITHADLASYEQAQGNRKKTPESNYTVDRKDQRDTMAEAPRTEREARMDLLYQRYSELIAVVESDFWTNTPIHNHLVRSGEEARTVRLPEGRIQNPDGTEGLTEFSIIKGEDLTSAIKHLKQLVKVLEDIKKFE